MSIFKSLVVSFSLIVFIVPSLSSAQQTADIETATVSSTCVTINTNLSYVNRKTNNQSDVISLQDFLNTQKYLNDSSVTGFFGTLTRDAVLAFQKDNGILPALLKDQTGFVGSVTRAKINEISCNGGNNNTTNVVTTKIVNTTPVNTAPPTAFISVSPTSITVGQSAIIKWSSTGATSCQAYGTLPAWATKWVTVATSSATSTGAMSSIGKYYYNLSCSGPNGTSGTQTASVEVTPVTVIAPTCTSSQTVVNGVCVTPAVTTAPTMSVSVSSTSISTGQSATITWSSTGATACYGQGDTGGSIWKGSWNKIDNNGSISTGILSSAKTYSYFMYCNTAKGIIQPSDYPLNLTVTSVTPVCTSTQTPLNGGCVNNVVTPPICTSAQTLVTLANGDRVCSATMESYTCPNNTIIQVNANALASYKASQCPAITVNPPVNVYKVYENGSQTASLSLDNMFETGAVSGCSSYHDSHPTTSIRCTWGTKEIYSFTYVAPATTAVTQTVTTANPATTSLTDVYKMYLNGSQSANITTQNVSRDYAVKDCATNHTGNPTSAMRCTWGTEEIYSFIPVVKVSYTCPSGVAIQVDSTASSDVKLGQCPAVTLVAVTAIKNQGDYYNSLTATQKATIDKYFLDDYIARPTAFMNLGDVIRMDADRGITRSYIIAPTAIKNYGDYYYSLTLEQRKFIIANGWFNIIVSNYALTIAQTLITNIDLNAGITRTLVATLTPSATSCDIPLGKSTCTVPFTWDNSNSTSPNIYNGTTKPATPYSTLAKTTTPTALSITQGKNTIQARNGENVITSSDVTGNCTAGTKWNLVTCITPVPLIAVTAIKNQGDYYNSLDDTQKATIDKYFLDDYIARPTAIMTLGNVIQEDAARGITRSLIIPFTSIKTYGDYYYSLTLDQRVQLQISALRLQVIIQDSQTAMSQAVAKQLDLNWGIVRTSALNSSPVSQYVVGGVSFDITAPATCKTLVPISRGSWDNNSNSSVTALQNFLAKKYNLNINDFVTGYYGDMTVQQVKIFQADNNLEAVGYVGSATRDLIKSQCSN